MKKQRTKERKATRIFKAICVLLCMMLMLTACGGNGKKYEGTYVGQQGNVLVLEKDGTCTYNDVGYAKTISGTWQVKDGRLIVHGLSYGGTEFDIYANIENDSEALLFEADDSHWRAEIFKKSE